MFNIFLPNSCTKIAWLSGQKIYLMSIQDHGFLGSNPRQDKTFVLDFFLLFSDDVRNDIVEYKHFSTKNKGL